MCVLFEAFSFDQNLAKQTNVEVCSSVINAHDLTCNKLKVLPYKHSEQRSPGPATLDNCDNLSPEKIALITP